MIPKGTELPILGAKINVNWIPVSYQGKLGFVLDQYVEVEAVIASAQPAPPLVAAQPSPSPSPAPLTPGTTQPPQMRVNSPDGVNLRSGPAMDQSVLTVLPHNTRVTVASKTPDGKWAQVTVAGQTGWVDSQYLASVDATTPPADAGPGTAAGSAKYIWPVSGRSITTYFGPGHPGIDVDQYPAGGNPVVAIAAGKVTFSGGNACCSYGLYVKVEHKDGAVSLYAHLQSMDVHEGQEVSQGQTLGRSGNTGFSTGAHLHFELFIGGGQVDPLGHLGR